VRSRISIRSAQWVLERFVPEGDREAIVGDLLEESAANSTNAPHANSALWCWRQALASVPPLFWASVRRGAWIASFGVGMGGFLVLFSIHLFAERVLASVLTENAGLTGPLLVVGLVSSVTVGFVAARVRRGAASMLALIIGVVLLTRLDSTNVAFSLTVMAAYIGGVIHRVSARI
jgi:hypothetical protein